MSWALPDTKTIHVTITMVLPLRGGGNGIYHEVQFNRSSSSEHDSDRENPKDGPSSRQLALVQDQPQTPFSRDRLIRFGFGSKTTAHPALIGSSRTTNKGSESEENTRSNFGEVKYCVQGRESQVLFGISDLAREKIQQKETKSLHCEGIDQIIQGLYSLDLFRSREVADSEKRTEELMDQILELNKKISEMEGELAHQKEVAKDAEDRSFNRGYERACRDIEECIANEHPEWDLSFIQS
ncbi:hypothetical protein Syun_024846 [Stephania yunnanensis]|uniref:Uncharacterized protein n=1 Tax=Stephania yunnanensis TaxID=152371 RepID=A0AAP0HV77_9MAGN